MDSEGYLVNHNEEGPENEAEDPNDLEYTVLLGTMSHLFIENSNPDMAEENLQKLNRLLEVRFRVKGPKSYIPNFMNLCKAMRRPPDHVMAFFLNDTGTSGSLGKQRLVVEGRFFLDYFEVILFRYFHMYVICHRCKSTDTVLLEVNGILSRRCEMCNHQRSVAPIIPYTAEERNRLADDLDNIIRKTNPEISSLEALMETDPESSNNAAPAAPSYSNESNYTFVP